MNSFAKIKKACKNAGLPAYPDYNTNNEDMYVVYNIMSETPDLFGDDEPNAIVASLQAHLYMNHSRKGVCIEIILQCLSPLH